MTEVLPTTACSITDAPTSITGSEDIRYVVYTSELQLPPIMRLIEKDLSEPYTIYTYRYFLQAWPDLCYTAMSGSTCIGVIICRLDKHRDVMRGYIAMLAVSTEHRKRGIGSKLVKMAIRQMKENGADEMAQLALGAVSVIGTIASAGIIYFQPHSVIAILVKSFPRIIWCLSHVSPPLKTEGTSTRHRTTSDGPSEGGFPFTRTVWMKGAGWARFRKKWRGEGKRVYNMALGAIGGVVGRRGGAYTEAADGGGGGGGGSSSDTELQEYRFEEGVVEDFEDPEGADGSGLYESLGRGTGATMGSENGGELPAHGPTLDVEVAEETLDVAAMEEGRVSERPAGGHEEEIRLPGVKEKVIALTVDDSPSVYSAEMLDILKENGCHATFFIIGDHVEKLQGGEEILGRMVREGHELGNHTWYDRPTIRLPKDVYENELLRMDALIQKINAAHSSLPTSSDEEYQPHLHTAEETGTARQPPPKWFRPGQGWFSHEMCDIAENHGYRTVLGCRFPLDTASPDPQLNAWHVLQGIHPGAIVVLHDARERIKQTLRILLPELVRMGYKVTTISELYKMACEGVAMHEGCGLLEEVETLRNEEEGLVVPPPLPPRFDGTSTSTSRYPPQPPHSNPSQDPAPLPFRHPEAARVDPDGPSVGANSSPFAQIDVFSPPVQ
ncbi:hypothetical protein HDU97_002195 [Phlyctochytrium planicorne]|nr:hypothetical protein HDU97_002195 [Phlyctochytrium planicorne]